MVFDPAQRIERHATQGNDVVRIDRFDLSAEVRQAGAHFTHRRTAVVARGVEWVAEDGVGDEDVFASQTRDSEQRLEAPPGLVAAERHAAAAGAEDVAVRHAIAGKAALDGSRQGLDARPGCHAGPIIGRLVAS
jgi:hypothetical protein